MNIKVDAKRVEETSISLTVRVAAADLEELKRGARLVVAQRNGIDLSGEATASEVLAETLGEHVAASLVLQALKNFTAPFALSEDGGDYAVVGAPAFGKGDRTDENGDFLFEATWTRLPPMELSSYEPVEIAVPTVAVSEDEIDARIEEIAGSYTTVERDEECDHVADGSIVQISMECLKDGERFNQLSFKNRLYRAGSDQMPAGFDEALMGVKVGQQVRVDFLLPVREELDGTLSGPSICADVKVEAIMREAACNLTDDFIAHNIPHANSIEELRAQCRDELAQAKADQLRHYRNFLAASELAKRLTGTIPDAAYEAVATQMEESLVEQARAERTTVSALLKAQGSSEEQFRMMALVQARTQLRQGAALDAWARHWDIEVTDEDIDAFFASSAPDQAAAQMRDEVEGGGYRYLVREGALRLKASEDVVAQALITEDPALPLTPPAAVEA